MAKLSEVPKTSLAEDTLDEDRDFSLVLGGPLYQLYLRTRLTRDPLALLVRRVLVISGICWVPLLLLTMMSGHTVGGIQVPFLFDLDAHGRFLLALPLLIVAEVEVHRRIQPVLYQFLDREIIAPESRSQFKEIIDSTLRLRNSVLAEVIILIVAYASYWLWRYQLTLSVSTWYAIKDGAESRLTPAGYWYAFISLPILRLILYRWYYRLFLWYRVLWKVRALPLHLNLFHPDRCGGLGFLASGVFAMSPVLVAHTVFLSSLIGDRIWHAGATLPQFKLEIVGAILFLMLVALAPLSFFIVHLALARRIALREYGILASHYVDDFRQKWVKGKNPDKEAILGTGDIQSLADLGNAYSVVTEMRVMPFSKESLVRLAIMLIVPLLPLTLTVIPLEKMIDSLIKLAI